MTPFVCWNCLWSGRAGRCWSCVSFERDWPLFAHTLCCCLVAGGTRRRLWGRVPVSLAWRLNDGGRLCDSGLRIWTWCLTCWRGLCDPRLRIWARRVFRFHNTLQLCVGLAQIRAFQGGDVQEVHGLFERHIPTFLNRVNKLRQPYSCAFAARGWRRGHALANWCARGRNRCVCRLPLYRSRFFLTSGCCGSSGHT